MIFFVLFGNGHFHNAVSTLTNVVKLDFEKDNVASTLSNVVHMNVEMCNVDSTLFDVVNSNVDIDNVVSTLIWRCPSSQRHINKKKTLKQRWNVCWAQCSIKSYQLQESIWIKTSLERNQVWEVKLKHTNLTTTL